MSVEKSLKNGINVSMKIVSSIVNVKISLAGDL